MPDRNDHTTEQAIQRVITGLGHLEQTLDPIRLPVIGNSMAPMLRDRDILDVSFNSSTRLKCGDVIVRGRHELITHRVIVTRRNRVYTKGDARYWIDPVIDRRDILGIVNRVDRNGVIADMGSAHWTVINKLIGTVAWIQVYLTWRRQAITQKQNNGSVFDRLSFWISKKLNWIILLLFAGKWIRQKPLRMDEKC